MNFNKFKLKPVEKGNFTIYVATPLINPDIHYKYGYL